MLADAPMGDIKVAADSAHLAAVRAEFPDYEQLVAEARAAQEAEHEMTFFQAVKRYPKAIGFSVIISLAM
jgi:SP family general alpha glucoside:H+ symporter-like MFS transporter